MDGTQEINWLLTILKEILNQVKIKVVEGGSFDPFILVIILGLVIVGLLVFFFLIRYGQRIVAAISWFEKRKINRLEESLKSNYIQDSTQEFLETQLNLEYFKISMGISRSITPALKASIISFYNHHDVHFYQILKAMPYLRCRQDQLEIQMDGWEKFFSFWLGGFLCILCILGGSAFFTLLLTSTTYSFEIVSILLGISLFLWFAAFLIFVKTIVPCHSASRLKSILDLGSENNNSQ